MKAQSSKPHEATMSLSKTDLISEDVITSYLSVFCRLTDLSGSLTDGPVNYKYKTKCTWLIEG